MGLLVNPEDRKPAPEAPKVNTRLPIIVGLVLWSIALLFLLLEPAQTASKETWWPLTCIIGIGLGLVAIFFERDR
ncbi:MAG: DUF2530 domain-containing protein [Micrococcales bacterium]